MEKKLNFVNNIPNSFLARIDINPNTAGDVNSKRGIYFEIISRFILNKSGHLLNRLISVNKSRILLEDQKAAYSDIMRKYNKSIKEYYDKYNKISIK